MEGLGFRHGARSKPNRLDESLISLLFFQPFSIRLLKIDRKRSGRREITKSDDYFRSVANFYVTEHNPIKQRDRSVDRPATMSDDVDVISRQETQRNLDNVVRRPKSSPT